MADDVYATVYGMGGHVHRNKMAGPFLGSSSREFVFWQPNAGVPAFVHFSTFSAATWSLGKMTVMVDRDKENGGSVHLLTANTQVSSGRGADAAVIANYYVIRNRDVTGNSGLGGVAGANSTTIASCLAECEEQGPSCKSATFEPGTKTCKLMDVDRTVGFMFEWKG